MLESGHHHHIHLFPKGFLWGTATSAHQVEGQNYSSDWWAYEQQGKLPKSGKAVDHYNRYKEDFDLAQKMNNNAHRLSIEWARVEPRAGEFNMQAIEHYRKVLTDLKERQMIVMLTLHHFTNPKWFADKGGFARRRNVRYFTRYVKLVAKELGHLVDMWVTINEPGVYVYQGYQEGIWPPFNKSRWLAVKVYLNLARAHKKAYKIIHAVCDDGVCSNQVGIAQNVLSYATYRKNALLNNLAVWLADKVTNHGFYILTRRKTHDFLGINFYFRVRLKRVRGLKFVQDDVSSQERETSDIGWEIYPHGLFDVLMDFRDYNMPVYVTENGIAAENDDKRQRFIVAHLNEVYHALKGGADMRGYFHWSLLDNYEWHLGYPPKFGLVDVDRKTFKRKLKSSGKVYGEIAKVNGLEHKMFRLLGHEAKLR